MLPEEKEIIEGRLENWGLFNRLGNKPRLGITSYSQLMSEYIAHGGHTQPDEIDAMYIGDIISSLDIAARRGDINWGDVYAFVLYQEYIRSESAYKVKAEKTRKRFGFPCAIKTFKKHVRIARITIHYCSEPIVNKVVSRGINQCYSSNMGILTKT